MLLGLVLSRRQLLSKCIYCLQRIQWSEERLDTLGIGVKTSGRLSMGFVRRQCVPLESGTLRAETGVGVVASTLGGAAGDARQSTGTLGVMGAGGSGPVTAVGGKGIDGGLVAQSKMVATLVKAFKMGGPKERGARSGEKWEVRADEAYLQLFGGDICLG